MPTAIAISDVLLTASSSGGLPPGAGAAPGNSTGLVVTGFIDPTTNTFTLSVAITPPVTIGTFIGCHLYLEIPDQSAAATFSIGSGSIGDGSGLAGNWSTIDLGNFVYVASQQPWSANGPAPATIDATKNIPCRLYAVSISTVTENKLIRAGLSGASPNDTFTLVSLTSGSPTAGTNVTAVAGPIVATALSPVNVSGKLETPVIVDLSTVPDIKGWCFRLVVTYGTADPTVVANQFVVSGVQSAAGPVASGVPDGISIPHSFILATPKTVQTATVWCQSGLLTLTGASRTTLTNFSGAFKGNNIVPGITPSFPFTYGGTTGTLDASAVMTATITASMAVVSGLFGVAASGITNSLLGPLAVATINIKALAITNPLLASLCVQAAQLATGSVTATAIGALAVGTAAIQTAAITNALIANAAVSSAQIISATILGANIASATIAGANIGTATIAQGNMASASIGTAQIQSLAVTDALIANCSIGKLTAGSANFTGTATFANGSNLLQISSSGIIIGTTGSSSAVDINGSTGAATFTNSSAVSTVINGNAIGTGSIIVASLQILLGLALYPGVGSASAGSASLPSNPVGFINVTVGGSNMKIPYYNV